MRCLKTRSSKLVIYVRQAIAADKLQKANFSYGNIYTYSFALTPEKMEPTGSCNFSRVDNATLYLKVNDICYCTGKPNEFVNIRVYAINYNILRIMSGMGGLAYSN